MALKTLKLALISGGPSEERGISLNSARSVIDHLYSSSVEIVPLFVDRALNFYQISSSQLYSNTPSDFDFKIAHSSEKLTKAKLKELLKSVDLVFPVIHGRFGEDGTLQKMLEEWNIPFIGHPSHVCLNMFSKINASEIISKIGFKTVDKLVFSKEEPIDANQVEQFFFNHCRGGGVVKPDQSGSSIGVHLINGPEEAIKSVQENFRKGYSDQAILEPFLKGKEFTLVVLENKEGRPAALMPTEIEIKGGGQLFDYRKKYLPTTQVFHHTPPRFTSQMVSEIRRMGEELFIHFGMRDFARLDGWVLEDGSILFTDLNPISGLEQNSFFFRQAAFVGLRHIDVLEMILESACKRFNLPFQKSYKKECTTKKKLFILFGSSTSERQVSLMSGTNVWFKMLHSQKYEPTAYFYDQKEQLWDLPYSYSLSHTVEEVYEHCKALFDEAALSEIASIREQLLLKTPFPCLLSKPLSKEAFFVKAKQEDAFVFIALHGGEGEDGSIQRALEERCIPFNGSSSLVSAVCMDKYETGLQVNALKDQDFYSLPKVRFTIEALAALSLEEMKKKWQEWSLMLSSHSFVVKPCSDGCSAGIVVLNSPEELASYIRYFQEEAEFIPQGSFGSQKEAIQMPADRKDLFLLEPAIETDKIEVVENALKHTSKSGWIELTVGLMEKKGEYKVLNPSITISNGSILSLEEKFQGGTGINLTPPPEVILTPLMTASIKQGVEKVAKAIGIENYARIDLFFNRITGKTVIIEVNSLPALTPSTVIYHQALAETPPIAPLTFLETIVEAKL